MAEPTETKAGPHPLKRRAEEVADALRALGSAYRNDWSNFEGRTLQDDLYGLADALTMDGPDGLFFDSRHWLAQHAVCPLSRTWADYCGQAKGYTCPHIEAELSKRGEL